MAWQLHYTSARKGPTGRAGFQFVAETPGLPEGARAGVTPYLSYRPPPDAPLSPNAHELERFPVVLLYDWVAGRPLLLRCRYLGRDYSGRYGNFFAHAVLAEREELEGLRPAELWHAPLWDDAPVDEGVLPELDELVPGAESDPEFLAEWLAEENAYALLDQLMAAVAEVLAKNHGQVVLVADNVEQVARWIAVVSYSLPVASAAKLSFVTYSADPDGAAQQIVGTTPDVWASVQKRFPHVFRIDLSHITSDAPPSRYAQRVAACWREFDFAGLDALGELATSGDPNEARDLGEVARIAATGGTVDASQIREAAARCVREGKADLARVPGGLRGPLLDGVLSGLAEAGRDVRRAVLTGPACEALYEERDRLMTVPKVAVGVLVIVAVHRPERRVEVTGELLRLGRTPKALGRVWAEPPSAADCLALLDAHPEEFAAPGVLAGLPSRTFARIAATGDAELRAPETQQLVARVRAARLDPGGESSRAAAAIGSYTDAVTAEWAERSAEALGALMASEAPQPLVEDVFAAAAQRLAAQRAPRFRAVLLAASSGAVRARLGALWVKELPRSQRNELMEVVLRLRQLGIHEAALEGWGRAAAGRWLSARMLDAHFAGEPRLRAALKDLVAEARGRGE